MNQLKDKTIPQNWINGDIFALKITNTNTIYDGRYLILIKYTKPDWKQNYWQTFRAKITKDDNIPSLNEIKYLEYIKTMYIHYYKRFLPIERTIENTIKMKKNKKFYPDEYNYMYCYFFNLTVKKNKSYKNLIFLGNQIYPEIKEEYYNGYESSPALVTDYKDLIKDLIKCYENYNLKKSEIYNGENRKIIQWNVYYHMIIMYNLPFDFNADVTKDPYDLIKDKY